MSKENPIYKRKTYCNPLSIPCIPKGGDCMAENDWQGCMGYTGEPEVHYRSISDPSIMYYDNKWYMYPSYGMCFVSEDFANWEHIPMTPYNLRYSPSVVPHRGKFLLTGHANGLYISDSPTGPFDFVGNFKFSDGREYTLKDGNPVQPIDSALFRDDDGRIYIYFFDTRPGDGKYEPFVSQTYGVELDPDDPTRFMTDPVLIAEFNGDNVWERDGAYNQNPQFGWCEGQWMFKHNGRYYFIYSSSNTTCKNYCMAAYYSDESPLTGFVLQKNNPITIKTDGLASGAGHGCIEHGPDNSLWAFYTITHCAVHAHERRIGMAPIGVDENGELYCPAVTDTPQFAYGETENYLTDSDTGLLPLTFAHRHHMKSSSAAPGRGTVYAFDESALTWWQPADDDNEPTLYIDLEATYVCEASRIMWREIGLDYDNGILPESFKYIIESRPTLNEGEWEVMLDMSKNEKDLVVDYQTFAPIVAREIRLRVLSWPKGTRPAVTSFTIFGTKDM